VSRLPVDLAEAADGRMHPLAQQAGLAIGCTDTTVTRRSILAAICVVAASPASWSPCMYEAAGPRSAAPTGEA
jgi:hypothetical protein